MTPQTPEDEAVLRCAMALHHALELAEALRGSDHPELHRAYVHSQVLVEDLRAILARVTL